MGKKQTMGKEQTLNSIEELSEVMEGMKLKLIDFMIGKGLCVEDAEDIYQDTIYELGCGIQTQRYSDVKDAEAFIFGVIKNKTNTIIRKWKKSADVVDDITFNKFLELTGCDDEGDVIGYDDEWNIDYSAVLHMHLDVMKPKDRKIIYGFYVEGKSHAELAEELGFASPEVVATKKCKIMAQLEFECNRTLKRAPIYKQVPFL